MQADPQVVGRYGQAATVMRLDPESKADRHALVRHLLPAGVRESARRPLEQVVAVAQECGCRCIVVEERYIDPDYRSEYSAFWSRRFEDREALARRLHFFREPLNPEALDEARAESYIGYSVLRPAELGPVGRTVLSAPPRLSGARLTVVNEQPSFFGTALPVRDVPFCQQDGEFLACAHTVAWLCHYVAQDRGIIGRRVTAEIAAVPSPEGSRQRPLPSAGLTGEQLQAVFSTLGIPALLYDMDRLPKLPAELSRPERPRLRPGKREERHRDNEARERVLRVVCKYLNSGFPVLVLTAGAHAHTFTLVGWQ